MSLPIPEGKTLMPFQVTAINEALNWLKNEGYSACKHKSYYNAQEQGLGKSVQTVVTLNALACTKVLIICQKSMLLTWKEEHQAWSTRKLTYCVMMTSTDVLKAKNADVVICSYDLAKREKVAPILGNMNYHALVLDEAHNIKSVKSDRTRAVFKFFWPKAQYRICLSGTPFTQSLADGWTTFSRMYSFGTFEQFASRYSYVKHTPWGVSYSGGRNHDELNRIIKSNFFQRLKKEDVLPDLPEKTFQQIVLPSTYALKVPKTDHEKMLAEAKALTQRLENGENVNVPVSMQGQRRAQGLLKVKPVIEFVEELLEQEIPVVLVGVHRDVLNQFKEHFKSYMPGYIDGTVSATERHDAVKRFQDGATNLFIGQLVAAGTGITLTRSCNMIISEMDFSPSNLSQMVARISRIGSKYPATIYYFTAMGSLDETIEKIVIQKAKDFNRVVDGN